MSQGLANMVTMVTCKKRNRENCQEKDLSCKCFFTHLFFISWITWSPSHDWTWFHSRAVTIITDNRPLYLDRQEKTAIKPWNCLVFFPLPRRNREKSINILCSVLIIGYKIIWYDNFLADENLSSIPILWSNINTTRQKCYATGNPRTAVDHKVRLRAHPILVI